MRCWRSGWFDAGLRFGFGKGASERAPLTPFDNAHIFRSCYRLYLYCVPRIQVFQRSRPGSNTWYLSAAFNRMIIDHLRELPIRIIWKVTRGWSVALATAAPAITGIRAIRCPIARRTSQKSGAARPKKRGRRCCRIRSALGICRYPAQWGSLHLRFYDRHAALLLGRNATKADNFGRIQADHGAALSLDESVQLIQRPFVRDEKISICPAKPLSLDTIINSGRSNCIQGVEVVG